MKEIPKITSLLITKNEEKFIRDFILSMDFVDELIIVDSFSTDKTVAIIKEYPHVKLIQRKFDDFSSQKNFAISKASNDWILFFDGDEVVSPNLKDEILETLKNNTKNIGFWMYRSTIYMNKKIKYSGLQNDKVIRLFNKNFCKYDGKFVHETIISNGKTGFFKNKIKHYSFKGFDKTIKKRNKYAALQAQDLLLTGLRPNLFHFLLKPFFRFFKHYFIKLGFLDGYRGFFISSIYGYSVFVRYVKLWLLRNKNKPYKEQHYYPIDAVFTWVDGGDEKHQQKMKPFYKGKNDWNNEKFRTRFDQVNEIEFAVKSIIKFAPYIKTIFIVTDAQTPSFLENYNNSKPSNHPEIKIIDHQIIFKDYLEFLPVFNSLSIETLIYKTPNLAEHFIYFNDDFLLINKTKESDFFINGLPVLRGKWTTFDYKNKIKIFYNSILKLLNKKTKDKKFGYKRVQQNSAKLLNFKNKYFRINHTPMPMRKSTISNFYKENPNLERQNAIHKFRNIDQHLIQSIVAHKEIKNNSGYFKYDFQLLFLNSYKYPLFVYKNVMRKILINSKVLFLCFQSLDKAPHKISKFLFKKLNKVFDDNK